MNRRTVLRSLSLSLGSAFLLGNFARADERKEEKKYEKAKLTGSVELKGEPDFEEGTVVKVTLADVSLQDAPAKVLGQQNITDAKNFPVKFAVDYDPATVREGAMIAVLVRIETKGALRYITDTRHAVLTGDNPKKDVKISVKSIN